MHDDEDDEHEVDDEHDEMLLTRYVDETDERDEYEFTVEVTDDIEIVNDETDEKVEVVLHLEVDMVEDDDLVQRVDDVVDAVDALI